MARLEESDIGKQRCRTCCAHRFDKALRRRPQPSDCRKPTHKALRKLTKAGFYTSCYVDFAPTSELSDTDLSQCLDTLRAVADSGDVRALSFPGWWYETINERLDRNIDLLTREHRKTQLVFFLMPGSNAMLDDNRLKVILIKDKGKYHR